MSVYLALTKKRKSSSAGAIVDSNNEVTSNPRIDRISSQFSRDVPLFFPSSFFPPFFPLPPISARPYINRH